ncbi:hypothetical protein OG413_41555 [Streptomyces sp. NBC_01433]|uniref:hypothetical protein n=1 Tax=Streptomyces sp. NBC_01433 TaxID=2903864 RepID=UPI002251FFF7|nr:hypothetical protein [Streptomyces sp. NBC_01433]MCX4681691.1 hypothetical protein [Streptomyces sp. NBC_01433]
MDLILVLFALAAAVIIVPTVVVPWYYHRSSPLPPAVSRGRAANEALHRPEVSRVLALTGVVHIPLLLAATVLSATRSVSPAFTAFCALITAVTMVLTWLRWLLARLQPAALRDAFTVTAYLNGSSFGFDNIDQGIEVTTEGKPLRLVFTTRSAASAEEAARAAFTLSTSHGQDDAGQGWPADTRTLHIDDALTVTTPQGTVTRFAVEPTGISPLHTA